MLINVHTFGEANLDTDEIVPGPLIFSAEITIQKAYLPVSELIFLANASLSLLMNLNGNE